MKMADLPISSWHVYAALLAMLALGAFRAFRTHKALLANFRFANEFRDRFIGYCNSKGQDHDAFDWLIRRSHRMQGDMGELGIYGAYTPPFGRYRITNYPIILNMLPELRTYIERDFRNSFHDQTIDSFMRAIDEALLRYLGALEGQLPRSRRRLFNPIIWFRDGVGQVLALPLLLLSWFGLLGAATVNRIEATSLFKMLAAFGGIIGVSGSAMTIFLGWSDTVKKLSGLLANL
mgnify:CR=1 FL=1